MTGPGRITVRVTADMADDLAVITSTGVTTADAVRHAVALVADAHRRAWDHGDVPDGQPVHILGARYAMADGRPAPTPATADTRPSEATP